MALKPRSIKVDDETWEAWQGHAKPRGVSVAALILEGMQRVMAVPDSAPQSSKPRKPDPTYEAVKQRLHGERDKARKDLAAARQEIADLKRQLAARLTDVPGPLSVRQAPIEGRPFKYDLPEGNVLEPKVSVAGEAVRFNPKRSWKESKS
jgi:hypothetical protein